MPKQFTERPPEEPQDPPLTGNRCGHDPDAPRWFEPPADHKKRPPILRKWIERVRQFFHSPDRIPSLNGAHHARKLAANPGLDCKQRRMRSERREACCSLLGAIAHYCDLPTLCLSVPQADGSLLPVKLETLADRAGLSMRRAERAMRDIKDAGLVSTHERAEEKEDGTYRGHAAIRVVPKSFFGLFGLEALLANDRERMSQKRKKEQAEGEPNKTAKARVRTAVSGAMNKFTGKDKPKPPPTDSASFDLERPLGPAESAKDSNLRAMREILEGKASGPAQTSPRGDRRQAPAGRTSDQLPTQGRSRDPP